ncbi:helix-turn-helix domain-containing protein [Rothia koreensis]|uniref:helix-turn-helix domain-containing protein n=1 Tax=Rothia koreensis TaxID=592378 RepID=UPI0037C537B9
MTYELAAQAQRITRLTPAQKLVLMHLCQIANPECGWKVWHSQAQIRFMQGLGRNTVARAIKELEEQGLIRVGKFQSEMLGRNVYEVNAPKIETISKADAHKADEEVKAWLEVERDRITRLRQRTAIKKSLRVVASSYAAQDSA